MEILLEKSSQLVPKALRKSTPIALRATAGLRLLPKTESDFLLNAVRSIFLQSEFQVSQDAVEIMDEADEGIFSWFAVNFLLGDDVFYFVVIKSCHI